MVQTSVAICNNVNLDPEMCLRRGEGVKLQTSVAQPSCTILGSGVRTRSSPIGSAHVIVHRGFGKKMGFQVLLIFILPFKNIISYKQCIEHNNNIYD